MESLSTLPPAIEEQLGKMALAGRELEADVLRRDLEVRGESAIRDFESFSDFERSALVTSRHTPDHPTLF